MWDWIFDVLALLGLFAVVCEALMISAALGIR